MNGAMTSIRWRSDPQMPLEVISTMTSVGSSITGSGTVSTLTSARPCQVTARMRGNSLEWGGNGAVQSPSALRELYRPNFLPSVGVPYTQSEIGCTQRRTTSMQLSGLSHSTDLAYPRLRSRNSHGVFTWITPPLP